ncbi:MAG TPA: DNA internalization-related competence protein ComEC/Rec2 [Burkholderiaceae bacterium]|nr:DNA internalization-related competence protein ComEC/Rec2 [Burkholderiaceae bacterium]
MSGMPTDPMPVARALLPVGMAAFCVGAGIQLGQPRLWPIEVYAGGLVAGLALMLALGPRVVLACVLACVLAGFLVGFGWAGTRASWRMADALDPALEGVPLLVTGIVDAMPQTSELGVQWRFAVESAERADLREPVRLPPVLWLGWYASGGARPPELRAGERWRLPVRVKAPHGPRNPQGFDVELWMFEQGLHATGSVRSLARGARAPGDRPERLEPGGWRRPVEQARQSVRDAIYARLLGAPPLLGDDEGAPQLSRAQRAAGVVAALVVGDQRAIDRADWDVFRATGVAHLMSISGLHITLFAWLATRVAGAAWRRSRRLCEWLPAPQAGRWAGWLLALGYAVFSGFGVPAQRTAAMLTVAVWLGQFARRWPWPWTWLAAAAVVVAADPWALAQAGFWLSFVAVGLLIATDNATDHGRHAASSGRWAAQASRFGREQALITLGLAPLSLLLFGQVSLAGLAANAIAIPWVTFVVMPLALLGVLVPVLWQAAAWGVQALMALLQPLAHWSWAVWSLPSAPLWAGMLAVGGGLVAALPLPRAARALGLAALLPALLWQHPRPAPGHFELLAIDVGQGSAVLVRTATHALLHDAGPRFSRESDAGHRVVVPLLRAWGVKPDLLVLSHRDADHIGGADAVLGWAGDARRLSTLPDDHPLARAPHQVCAAGQGWDWDGVRFEVLHPAPGADRQARPSNALSCVLRAQAADGTAALLTGDIEVMQEADIVARTSAERLRADLMLAPHHGSATSSSEAWLDAVQPRSIVVQSGYRNRFGHPAAPVLARWRARGIAVHDSPACGAARWSSDARAVECERQQARRYWQHPGGRAAMQGVP